MTDKLKEYPREESQRNRLKGYIQEYSDAQLEIDSNKENQTQIAECVAEEMGIDKSWFKRQAALYHDNKFGESQKAEKIVQNHEELEEFEAMMS